MERFITAGVAGHVDHGKTNLVRCLTGIETDRLKEEKRRGLSIEPGVAPMQLPSGSRIALVDVPGHRDFLKNTIRGLSTVDMAILVVAADDGVMPQTRDHLAVLNFINAKGGITVLSKADLVDQETLELAEMEIREIVKGSFLENGPIIPYSAADGRGLNEIFSAVQAQVDCLLCKNPRGPFRLWIDQVRSFPGFGTVVSGTVMSGSIRRDDAVELLPSGKQAKVRYIEVHHQRADLAVAGERVGINVHGVSRDEVHVGTVLSHVGVLKPSRLLNVELSLLPSAFRPLTNRQRVKVYAGTYCTTALAAMMEGNCLYPGEKGLMQLRLSEPAAVLPGDSFVISPMNLNTVIGGGKILEAAGEKVRSSNMSKTLDYLQTLRSADIKAILRLFIAKFPHRPVTSQEIALAAGFPLDVIQEAAKSRLKAGKLLDFGNRGYFEKNRYELLKKRLIDVTKQILSKDSFKTAASGDEIRFRLEPSLDDAVFGRMLEEVCRDGKLAGTAGGYIVPNFAAAVPARRGKLIERLLEFAEKQGCGTFSVGTFWKSRGEGFTHRDVEKVVEHLCAQKKLVRLNDGRYLTMEALDEIKKNVRALIMRKGRMTIQDGREVLGYGRNRAVPVFDYLDSIGFTNRIEDERVLVTGETYQPQPPTAGSRVRTAN